MKKQMISVYRLKSRSLFKFDLSLVNSSLLNSNTALFFVHCEEGQSGKKTARDFTLNNTKLASVLRSSVFR